MGSSCLVSTRFHTGRADAAVANNPCWQQRRRRCPSRLSHRWPLPGVPRRSLSQRSPSSRDKALLDFPGHFCSASCSQHLLPKEHSVSPTPFLVWMWLPSPGLQPLGCSLRVAHEVAPQEDSTQAVEPQSGQLFPVGTNLASSDRGEKKGGVL